MITFACWIAAFVLADAGWKSRADRKRAALLWFGAAAVGAASFVLLPNLLYLGKVAGRLAMPVGWLWLALVGLTAAYWVRREHRRVVTFAVGLVVFSVLGNAPLGGAMLAALESDYEVADRFDGAPLDAVFVLGGSTSRSDGGPRLSDSGDRLLTAARVYRARQVGVLITSGSTIPGIGEQRDVAEEAAHILVDMGVPADAIIEIAAPKNSSEEVAAYKKIADEKQWTRMGIVTSAWHMRRVQRLCERQGLRAEPIPADFRGDTGWDGLLSLIPEANGFRNIQRASWELLGAAVGR